MHVLGVVVVHFGLLQHGDAGSVEFSGVGIDPGLLVAAVSQLLGDMVESAGLSPDAPPVIVVPCS